MKHVSSWRSARSSSCPPPCLPPCPTMLGSRVHVAANAQHGAGRSVAHASLREGFRERPARNGFRLKLAVALRAFVLIRWLAAVEPCTMAHALSVRCCVPTRMRACVHVRGKIYVPVPHVPGRVFCFIGVLFSRAPIRNGLPAQRLRGSGRLTKFEP